MISRANIASERRSLEPKPHSSTLKGDSANKDGAGEKNNLEPNLRSSSPKGDRASKDGAVEKTRTSTGFIPQRPQRCASTNSATTAIFQIPPASGKELRVAKPILLRKWPFAFISRARGKPEGHR